MEVRRPLTRYRFATITGISWTHDGVYSRPQARQLLGTDDPNRGLVVRFSKPVRSSTLVDGIVDLQVVRGARAQRLPLLHAEQDPSPPAGDYTDELRFRQTSDEGVELRRPRAHHRADGLRAGPLLPARRRHPRRRPGPAAPRLRPEGPAAARLQDAARRRRTVDLGHRARRRVFESWFYVREASK